MAVFQASFKRDNSEDINAIPLVELIAADEMLGPYDLNSGFRIRLRNRIQELQANAARSESNRALLISHLISFVGGIVTALIGVWVTNLW